MCDYCGVKNDIDLMGIHTYTVTRPESERRCPVCKLPLETIDIKSDGTFFIERCSECMGLFFDPGELNALLDKSVDHVYRIDYKRLWKMNQAGTRVKPRPAMYINCPVCNELMNRTNFGARSGVIIDQCTHGIWLDNGELRKLLEWRKAGGQLLHEKLLEEKEEREAKKRKKTKTGSAGLSSDAVFSSTMLSSSRYGNQPEIDLAPLLSTAAKAIWRLFT